MCAKRAVLLFLMLVVVSAWSSGTDSELEPRGKKKKIALLIYFADLIVKKIFVVKLIYAFVFWLVLHKAGYFLGWFVSYLKERKPERVPVYHHDDHQYLDYDPHHSPYGPPSYGPYKRS